MAVRQVGPVTIVVTCLRGGRAKVKLYGVAVAAPGYAEHYYDCRVDDQILLIPTDYVRAVWQADFDVTDLGAAIRSAIVTAERGLTGRSPRRARCP